MKKFAKPGAIVELVAIKREVLSPRAYLDTTRSNPAAIKSATYVAPRIGKPGFGGFEVEYRTPKLVPAE